MGFVEVKDWAEFASYAVTIVTLPFAILVWAWDQRKEHANDEEQQYQHLSDAYNAFLKVVLENPDLQLRTTNALHSGLRDFAVRAAPAVITMWSATVPVNSSSAMAVGIRPP